MPLFTPRLALVGTGQTVTTSQPLLNLTQTWNASGIAFSALTLNITNTASAAASSLLDLQVASVSAFTVLKTGVTSVNQSGVVAPTPAAGTSLQLIGPSSGTQVLELDSFAGTNQISGRQAGGTAASNAATGSGVTLMSMVGAGMNTSLAYTSSRGTIQIVSEEAFTDSAQGARISFRTTPIGSVTQAETFRISGSGNAVLGSPVSGNQAAYNFNIQNKVTGGTTAYAVRADGVAQSDVTATAGYFVSVPATLAAAFTLTNLVHFYALAPTIGSGSTVTSQMGFRAGALTGATNNYGFFSEVTAASARWAFFDNGGANSAFAGNVRIGGTTAPTVALDVTGAGLITGNLTFATAASGPIFKQGANGRVGTFVANGATPVTVANTSIAVTDAIVISLNAVGGTISGAPFLLTITASTGFTVASGAADTSTYNYAIIKNAA